MLAKKILNPGLGANPLTLFTTETQQWGGIDMRRKPMMRNFFRLFCIAAVFMLTATTAIAAELTWTGCGITKKAFMAEIAKAYEAKTGTKISLSGGGATKGIRSASAGSSDMGGTCRPWLFDAPGVKHPEEANAVLTQVAWDAIVVIVNPDNPVDNISLADLKKIYDGEITNWKDLGGPDKRIILVSREGTSSGVGHMFRLLVYKDADMVFKARSLKQKSTGPVEKKVENSEAALAVDGISSAKKKNLKFLSLDDVAPTKENIGAGKYPLFRPLYIATNKNAKDETKKVLDFMLSDEGQTIISAQGTVNLAEGAALTPLWQAKKADMGL